MSVLHKNICCGCSLQSPRRGDSNEYRYPQHRFLWRNKQNYPIIITRYPPYPFHWSKMGTPKIITVIYPKLWTEYLYHTVMCPKDVRRNGKQCKSWSDCSFRNGQIWAVFSGLKFRPNKKKKLWWSNSLWNIKSQIQKNIYRVCVFQVSQPYLGFYPDPNHYIVNCEQNVKFPNKWGKMYWKMQFLCIKYFDKIKCYADRPYLVSSELKPETHIFFFFFLALARTFSCMITDSICLFTML